MATVKKTYNGNDIMLFTENNKSLGHAQNHTFTVGVETREDNTKDSPRNPIVSLSKITYEITTENLYCEDFVTLFSYLVNGEPVKLKFGQKKDEGEKLPSTGEIEAWTLDGSVNYYEGFFILTSLNLNANTGETSTYSASFSAVGKVEQKNDIKTVNISSASQAWTQATESNYRLIKHDITEDTRLTVKMSPSGSQWYNYSISSYGICWGKPYGQMPTGQLSNSITFDNDSLTKTAKIISVTVTVWLNNTDTESHKINIMGENETIATGSNYMTVTRNVNHVIEPYGAWSTTLFGLISGEWCNAYGFFDLNITILEE